MRPTQINTTINMDGRAIARAVSTHQARDMAGPSRGVTGYDPSMTGMGAAGVSI